MAIVVGVNTYVTAAELNAYADARGIIIAGEPDVLLVKAMDYLDALEGSWQATRTDAAQALAWPRYPVYIYGSLQTNTAIPQQLKNGQMQLAIEADTQSLIPTTGIGGKGSVIEETVDVITVKYAEGDNNSQPIFSAVNKILKPLLSVAGGGSNFNLNRN
jgi:hypothetical protein